MFYTSKILSLLLIGKFHNILLFKQTKKKYVIQLFQRRDKTLMNLIKEYF